MLPSPGETEAVAQKNATSMQETLLAMRPLELDGDDEGAELRAASRSDEIAKRCRMHEVGGRGTKLCVWWKFSGFEATFLCRYSVKSWKRPATGSLRQHAVSTCC